MLPASTSRWLAPVILGIEGSADGEDDTANRPIVLLQLNFSSKTVDAGVDNTGRTGEGYRRRRPHQGRPRSMAPTACEKLPYDDIWRRRRLHGARAQPFRQRQQRSPRGLSCRLPPAPRKILHGHSQREMHRLIRVLAVPSYASPAAVITGLSSRRMKQSVISKI